jgi:hypothetical protein
MTLPGMTANHARQPENLVDDHLRSFLLREWVLGSIMARAAQIVQIIICTVILVLGVLAYLRYLELAPMD